MHVQIEKSKENRGKGGANSVAQKKGNGQQGFGFVDNRTNPKHVNQFQGLVKDQGQFNSGDTPQYEQQDTSKSVVQKVKLYKTHNGVRKPRDKDNQKNIIDTTGVPLINRDKFIESLGDIDSEIVEGIIKEWTQQDATDKPDLEVILAVGDALTRLESVEALSSSDVMEIAQIIAQLDLYRQATSRSKEGATMQTLKDTITPLLQRAYKLWSTAPSTKGVEIPFTGQAPAIRADDFTDDEIAAYRDDIRQQGVWGGLAEADVGATRLGFSTTIFRVDPSGNYRRIINIGAGGASLRQLLHRGNHYEVVTGAAEGVAFANGHIVHPTETNGDCLFEGLLIVLTGLKLSDSVRPQSVLGLRRAIADALSPAQIRATLEQIILFGEVGGMGDKTKGVLKGRERSPSQVEEQLKKSEVEESEYGYMLREYASAYEESPISKQSQELHAALEALLPSDSSDGDGLYKGPVERGKYELQPDSIDFPHAGKHRPPKNLVGQDKQLAEATSGGRKDALYNSNNASTIIALENEARSNGLLLLDNFTVIHRFKEVIGADQGELTHCIRIDGDHGHPISSTTGKQSFRAYLQNDIAKCKDTRNDEALALISAYLKSIGESLEVWKIKE